MSYSNFHSRSTKALP
jgi:carboxymethylenebutenolidase